MLRGQAVWAHSQQEELLHCLGAQDSVCKVGTITTLAAAEVGMWLFPRCPAHRKHFSTQARIAVIRIVILGPARGILGGPGGGQWLMCCSR